MPTGSGVGATVDLVAQGIAFDQKTLSGPPNQSFVVDFDNQDAGTPHNFAIYTDKTAANVVFRGQIITGPARQAYSVPALKPGSYFFRCDVHPTQMFGTLVVK